MTYRLLLRAAVAASGRFGRRLLSALSEQRKRSPHLTEADVSVQTELEKMSGTPKAPKNLLNFRATSSPPQGFLPWLMGDEVRGGIQPKC